MRLLVIARGLNKTPQTASPSSAQGGLYSMPPWFRLFAVDMKQAQSLADEYFKRNPKNTLGNNILIPVIRAAIEIRRHNPEQAIQLLQSTIPYGGAADRWPEYIRGLAYLEQSAEAEAAAEFQKILDHRGWGPTGSYLYPLAHLGLARAAAFTATRRKAARHIRIFSRCGRMLIQIFLFW